MKTLKINIAIVIVLLSFEAFSQNKETVGTADVSISKDSVSLNIFQVQENGLERLDSLTPVDPVKLDLNKAYFENKGVYMTKKTRWEDRFIDNEKFTHLEEKLGAGKRNNLVSRN